MVWCVYIILCVGDVNFFCDKWLCGCSWEGCGVEGWGFFNFVSCFVFFFSFCLLKIERIEFEIEGEVVGIEGLVIEIVVFVWVVCSFKVWWSLVVLVWRWVIVLINVNDWFECSI